MGPNAIIPTQNYNQDVSGLFLPNDLTLKIVKEHFNFNNIDQVYKCNRVCKTWKVLIEDNCEHIFKKAKEILQLKEEKGIPNKLLVFEGIQALRKQCGIGDQKLQILTQILKQKDIFYNFDNELTSMKEARNGFNAHRLLTYVGQSTWNSVMQYIPVLPMGTRLEEADDDDSKTKTSYLDSLRNELYSALIQAVRQGFFDDAMTIFQKTSWRQNENKAKEAFLYYCYINQQFEQAEKFGTDCFRNVGVAERVYSICGKLLEENNLEIVKQITSKVLPGLENRAMEMIKEQMGICGLDELFWLFNTYIITRNFQHMNKLLFEDPKLADQMLEHYREWENDAGEDETLPQSVKIFLKEFVNGTLSKEAVILDQTLQEMTQKLNKNTGLKRSNPFDNPFDDAVNDLKTAMVGLSIQLMLYKFGKNNWRDVQKYIPVLTKGSHARGFTMNNHCLKVLWQTLMIALDHHFNEDAMTIYRETLWNRPFLYQSYILLHYFRHEEFEQTEQFIKENKLSDLDVVPLVLRICGILFQDEKTFEEAERIATTQLPSRAKGAKDTLHTNMKAVKEMILMLSNPNFARLYKYLSNNQESLGEDFTQLISMLRSYKTKLVVNNKLQGGYI